VVITFTEITQVKKAGEQERLLAAVLIASDDAIMVHDFSGRVKIWNMGAERMFGYSEVQAMKLNAEFLIPAAHRAETRSIWERLRQGERIDPYEALRQTQDNRLLDVLVTATVITDEADHPVAIANIERDITERKRAQAYLEQEVGRRTAALREQQERLRAILNSPSDAIISIDHGGTIESVNLAAERMFGYTAAEMIGQNVKMLMPASYRDEHDRYLARYLKTGEKRVIGIGREVTGRRKDGSVFPADLAVSEVEHYRLFTGILRDTTLRKNLEKEVVEIATLEQQRIGADLHDQVGQELTALSLVADGLLESVQNHSPGDADTVRKVNQGLKDLIRQVREFSRGLIPFEVDAQGLAAALAELAADVSDKSGVRCVFIGDAAARVNDSIKAQHLYRIAQEACTNAIKHGKVQSIEIGLKVQEDRMVLRIVDDGIGLGQLSREGLGLRIMRIRAGLIQADLSIQSVQPHGTQVTCTLIKEQPDDAQPVEPNSSASSDR
jgi:PAS domain S-box-containing protein